MTSLPLIALGIAAAAATLPVTVEVALLTAASLLPLRRSRRPRVTAKSVQLAILTPAHNEELLIAKTVASLRASAAGSGSQILVVAHNCSDETAKRAAEAGAEVLELNDPDLSGKGFALRFGFDRVFAEGADAALVVDADSTVSPNLIERVRERFAAGADGLQCRYELCSPNERTNSGIAALALRGFNRLRPLGRSRLGLSCGILGNGFAISSDVYSAVPYDALSLVEDLEYHIHLVMSGRRVEWLDEAQVYSDLPVSAAGAETQRSRWEGGRYQAARQMLWPMIKRVARGEWRLAEPVLDLASLPLAFAVASLLGVLALPLWPLRLYAALSLAAIGFHVLAAAWAGDDFSRDLRILLGAPFYIVWKLRLLPRMLRGSRAGWRRTERMTSPQPAEQAEL